MRFLYGDSVPFPPQYDFLGALKIFVDQATLAARLDGEGRAAMEVAEVDATNRQRAIEALEGAHFAAMHALQTATTGGQPLIADYALKVQEFATSYVGHTKQDALNTAERAREGARAKTENGRMQLRNAVDQILIALRLPVQSSEIVMDFSENANDFQSILRYPDGIASAYALSVDMLEEWKRPKRVSDFTSNVTLPVGLKKSIFKRGVSYESLTLDEYFLGGFELADDTAQLRLRKKPDQKDALVFDMKYTDAGFYAEVQHPGEPDAATLEPVLDQHAAVELERFVMLLRSAAGAVVKHKSRVLGITIHGHDVFDDHLVNQLLTTIVKQLVPTVAEISRRSTSPIELTLKTEDETGKRQEIYVKKAELYAKIDGVPLGERPIFDPLRAALDVTPGTAPPPSVR
ncbi:MAG TPA: hypothetical protein VGH87_02380 [Polyangiaceae bacterium]|jgi:hypothetical protein